MEMALPLMAYAAAWLTQGALDCRLGSICPRAALGDSGALAAP